MEENHRINPQFAKAMEGNRKTKTENSGSSTNKGGSLPMPTKTVALTGIVTMGAYTAAVYLNPNMKTYGWINYGDNNGRIEIATKEEYEAKFKQYMER